MLIMHIGYIHKANSNQTSTLKLSLHSGHMMAGLHQKCEHHTYNSINLTAMLTLHKQLYLAPIYLEVGS